MVPIKHSSASNCKIRTGFQVAQIKNAFCSKYVTVTYIESYSNLWKSDSKYVDWHVSLRNSKVWKSTTQNEDPVTLNFKTIVKYPNQSNSYVWQSRYFSVHSSQFPQHIQKNWFDTKFLTPIFFAQSFCVMSGLGSHKPHFVYLGICLLSTPGPIGDVISSITSRFSPKNDRCFGRILRWRRFFQIRRDFWGRPGMSLLGSCLHVVVFQVFFIKLDFVKFGRSFSAQSSLTSVGVLLKVDMEPSWDRHPEKPLKTTRNPTWDCGLVKFFFHVCDMV